MKGLPSSFYSDRASHYWITPKAGGRVNKHDLTQFGRAMQELGIQMIPSCSPEARGRSERMFRTLQDRLPKEMAMARISDQQFSLWLLIECYESYPCHFWRQQGMKIDIAAHFRFESG